MLYILLVTAIIVFLSLISYITIYSYSRIRSREKQVYEPSAKILDFKTSARMLKIRRKNLWDLLTKGDML